ncbi:MAG: uracil-DNA glycosylase family protein [Pseudomonadota bacterium]|nr:uracil-DNA glycosylase family protein [Pseudomonadota bacterium]
MSGEADIGRLASRIGSCRICVEKPAGKPLPHEPRPVVVLSHTARIAVCGQAPGTRVHASGRPFTDPSGDRLRDWMGIGEAEFYNAARLAIVPMGFCFPGLDARGADLPPRRECASAWHGQIFDRMPQLELLLVIGLHAQKWHLRQRCRANLTETVRDWRDILGDAGRPAMLPLPHPSWRNNAWIRKNPWFETDLLPELRKRVRRLI